MLSGLVQNPAGPADKHPVNGNANVQFLRVILPGRRVRSGQNRAIEFRNSRRYPFRFRRFAILEWVRNRMTRCAGVSAIDIRRSF